MPRTPAAMQAKLLVLLLAAALGAAHATPSLSLQTSAFTVSPGEWFTISLVLANPEALTIAGFNASVSASSPGIAELDSRGYPTVIDDPNSSLILPGYSITTANSADLGATSDFVSWVSGSGVIVAAFTFQALDTAAPGSYTLLFSGPGSGGVPTLSDISFTDFDNPSKLAATISVVPEPSSLLLVLGGAALSLRLRAGRRFSVYQ